MFEPNDKAVSSSRRHLLVLLGGVMQSGRTGRELKPHSTPHWLVRKSWAFHGLFRHVSQFKTLNWRPYLGHSHQSLPSSSPVFTEPHRSAAQARMVDSQDWVHSTNSLQALMDWPVTCNACLLARLHSYSSRTTDAGYVVASGRAMAFSLSVYSRPFRDGVRAHNLTISHLPLRW